MPGLDHFKFFAPYYDSIFQARLDEFRLRKFDVRPGMLILDAGGGTGRISSRFDCQTCNLVIADESRDMLRQTFTKDGLKPVNSLVEYLPFPDNFFDRVIMVDVLHHVLNQKHSAQEMWRIVKPGGKIIIEEPDITRFSIKLLALGEKIFLMRSHFLNSDEISILFENWDAKINVHRKDANIWVVIQKNPQAVVLG